MEENSVANAKRSELEQPPTPGPYPWPWLIYPHGEDYEKQTFCTNYIPQYPKKTEYRMIPELKNKKCWASSHGWCVFSDNNNDARLFLWNPITLEKIELPELLGHYAIQGCVLTSSPSEKKSCRILLSIRHVSLIMLHSLGHEEEEWKELDYKDELERHFLENNGHVPENLQNILLRDPVICNGKIYAHSSPGVPIFFNVEIDDRHRIALRYLNVNPTISSRPSCHVSTFFLESNGELYMAEIMIGGMMYEREIVGIEVHRLDFSLMCWEKVETLNDSVFFLHYSYSISCTATNPETQGNRLFFTFGEAYKKLYEYNFNDGSILPVFPLSSDCLPQQPSSYFWVMPQHPRKSLIKEEAEYETDDQEGHKESIHQAGYYFGRLPSDISSLIIKKLNLVQYLNFRASCRLFRSLAPIQQKLISSRLENHSFSSPLFVFFEKDRFITFLEPKHRNKYYLQLSQQLLRCMICYSKDGWFLMSGGSSSMYCFRPLTGEVLKFPSTPSFVFDLELRCMGFSISPAYVDCMVVFIYKSPGEINMHFGRRGDAEWKYEAIQDVTDFAFYDNSPVFYNNAFYYLGEKGDLGILEIMDKKISWKVVLSGPQSPCTECHQNFLVEYDGDLTSVFVGNFRNPWVEVFRLNRSKMTWTRLETLGKYVIYVSRSSSFAARATTPGMENKIYFPRFQGQSIVFYSLDTKKFHSFDQNDSPVEFYETREHLQCGWIEPR